MEMPGMARDLVYLEAQTKTEPRGAVNTNEAPDRNAFRGRSSANG